MCGPRVAALMITTMRMVSVSTIDRKDTWLTRECFTGSMTIGELHKQFCNHQSHLPKFLYVSIKWERQREEKGRQQDHKVSLCEYVIWTNCKQNPSRHNTHTTFCWISCVHGRIYCQEFQASNEQCFARTSWYSLKNFGQCVTSCDVVADHGWRRGMNWISVLFIHLINLQYYYCLTAEAG